MREIPRPTPALIISLLALTLALGGTGLAASRAPASVPQQASSLATWHNLTLKNGWVSGVGGTYHLSYYKDAAGIVHLRGAFSYSGSGSGPAFTLPKGARPKGIQFIEVYAAAGNAGAIEIDTNGSVRPFDNTGVGTYANVYESVDSVSFPTN